MPTTFKAAVHLGQNYNEYFVTHKNTNFAALNTLFDITQKLILNEKHEILNASTIEGHFTPCIKSTLLHEKAIKWAKAKVYENSDPVLCLGKMQERSEARGKWKDQLQYVEDSSR